MKPPPYTPEKFVKSTWFARPLRANILPHWSALVAHAPVSSNAFSSGSASSTEPAMIAVARTRFRSTIIGFFLEPLSVTAEHEEIHRGREEHAGCLIWIKGAVPGAAPEFARKG